MLVHCCSLYLPADPTRTLEDYLDLAISPKIVPVAIHSLGYTTVHFKLVSTTSNPGQSRLD